MGFALASDLNRCSEYCAENFFSIAALSSVKYIDRGEFRPEGDGTAAFPIEAIRAIQAHCHRFVTLTNRPSAFQRMRSERPARAPSAVKLQSLESAS